MQINSYGKLITAAEFHAALIAIDASMSVSSKPILNDLRCAHGLSMFSPGKSGD